MIRRLLCWWYEARLAYFRGTQALYADQEDECIRRWREAIRRQRDAQAQIGRYQSKLLASDLKAERARSLAAEY